MALKYVLENPQFSYLWNNIVKNKFRFYNKQSWKEVKNERNIVKKIVI